MKTKGTIAKLRARLASRAPIIGRARRRRAALDLAKRALAGDAEAVAALADALVAHPDPVVRDRAARTIAALANTAAIDAFAAAWFESRAPELAKLLASARHVACSPPLLKVLTALKVEKPAIIAAMGEYAVEPLVAACDDEDPEIAGRARDAIASLVHPRAIDVFCRHLMAGEGSALVPLARDRGFAPRDPAERALFFFVTEQWPAYEELDFEEGKPLLRQGYGRAADSIRRRFLAVARRSGRSHFVSAALTKTTQRFKVSEMGAVEWETIVEGLAREARWDEMWRLCFLAPVRFGAHMILELRNVGWRPPENEGALWDELLGLCPAEGKRLAIVPGDCIKVLEGHTAGIHSLSMNAAGTLLAGASGNAIRLWHLDDGAPPRALQGHSSPIACLCVAPDGLFMASAGEDRTVRLWTLPHATSPRRGTLLKTLEGHRDWVSCLALSPDGRTLASGSKDSTIRLWRFPAGAHLSTLAIGSARPEASWVLCLAFSPDGTLLVSGSKDSAVRLWSLPGGEHRKTLEGHRGGVLCLAIDAAGSLLASGGQEGTLRLWSLPEGNRARALPGHEGGVLCLAASPAGDLLASGGQDGTIRLWSLPGGEPIAVLTKHRGSVLALAMNPEGSVLSSASSDGTVALWSIPDGEPIATLTGHGSHVRTLSVSPDGSIVASGSNDKTVRLWRFAWTKPLALADHEDLTYVQRVLKERDLAAGARGRWRFLEALLAAKFRYDILLEESVVTLGSFDIEIEGASV